MKTKRKFYPDRELLQSRVLVKVRATIKCSKSSLRLRVWVKIRNHKEVMIYMRVI